MAASNRLIASIYRWQSFAGQSYDYPGVTGRQYNFPSDGTVVSEVTTSTTVNGVTMNAIIEVLPTGSNQAGAKYYAAATVSSIQSAGT